MSASPTDYRGYLGLGDYLDRSGRKSSAIYPYEQAVNLASTNEKPILLERLGTALGQTGDSERSSEIFRQLLQLDPANSYAWVGIGNNQWALGDLNEAVFSFKNVRGWHPRVAA